ncbi:MAG: fatty acid desaturase [Calothrix sp. MO_167.B12]|nr:fatty acid desaturase [Calothrix sp. MO_167.B12]
MMLYHYIARSTGLMVATTILGLWCISLSFLLSYDATTIHPLGLVLEILLQTFLDTGLFITAHEAMHGLVCPQNPTLNRGFGVLAISLYGLFDYEKLLRKHWLHHHYPASIKDPDFHDGKDARWFAWYLNFLKGYWHWGQFGCSLGIVILLGYTFHLAPVNLGLFWALPLSLSSLQLFYFGTFLPHRQPLGGYDNFHRANSTKLPILWSFLSCYHFGYHREHHEHPHVPWWQLPQLYRN